MYTDPTGEVRGEHQPLLNPQDGSVQHVLNEKALGARQRYREDLARVCAWTATRNRDGRLTVYGLNFRGQTVVRADEAVQAGGADGGQFVYTETFYTPEGHVAFTRDRMTGNGVFDENETGHTTYQYANPIPDEDDTSDVNNRLPFWAQRGNLESIVRFTDQRGGDYFEWQNPVLAEHSTGHSIGEYISFTYEPFFNQVVAIEEYPVEGFNAAGELILGPRTRYVSLGYDFNELIPGTAAADDFLASLEPYGYVPEPGDLADLGLCSSGDCDLNLDGESGFPHGALRGRGALLRRTVHGASHLPSTDHITFIWPSSSGAPGMIADTLGQTQLFKYYPTPKDVAGGYEASADPFGSNGNLETEPSTFASSYGGMLAQVETIRYADHTVENQQEPAPQEPQPCNLQTVPKQFRWVLSSAECGNDFATALQTHLGLPQDVVTSMMESQLGQPDSTSKTSFRYSVFGYPIRIWRDGLKSHRQVDADGRLLFERSALGAETTFFRNQSGQATKVEVRIPEEDDQGGNMLTLARRVHYTYDDEGRVTRTCTERTDGACTAEVQNASPDQYLLSLWTYSAEGLLLRRSDPYGLIEQTVYDALSRPVQTTYSDETGQLEPRIVERTFDNLNKLVMRRTLDQAGEGFTETFTYDGFGRLVSRTDMRGQNWHYAYDRTGRVSGIKASAGKYEVADGPNAPLSPTWENRWARNGDGHLLWATDNGINTVYVPDSKGRTRYAQTDGQGAHEWTYYPNGSVAWARSPDGTQHIYTQNPATRTATTSTIHRRGDEAFSISTVMVDDPVNREISTARYGSQGEVSVQNAYYDALGRTSETVDVEGHGQRSEWDLAGWPSRQVRTYSGLADVDETTYEYRWVNGQVGTAITDPRGGITLEYRDAFQQVTRRVLPGFTVQTPTNYEYAYDAFGRLVSETKPGNLGMLNSYRDPQTQALTVDLRQATEFSPQGQWTYAQWDYDSLGRLLQSTSYNPQLAAFNILKPTVTHEYTYDSAGRLNSETMGLDGYVSLPVTGNWSLVQPSIDSSAPYALDQPNSVWKRQLTYPESASWSYELDGGGRVNRVNENGPSVDHQPLGWTPMDAQLDWWGSHYVGRTQTWGPNMDPFREMVDLDGLGQTTYRTFTAVDLDNGNPTNALWADTYCPGGWDAARCDAPLYAESFIRDEKGRVRSLDWRFGRVGPVGQDPSNPQRWRGYNYGVRGHLDTVLERSDLDLDPSPTANLVPHTTLWGDVQMAAQGLTQAPDERAYTREADAVGSLTTLTLHTAAQGGQPAASEDLWDHPGLRSARLELSQLVVDGQSYSFTHDMAGRLTDMLPDGAGDGQGWSYTYDGMNRLVAVEDDAGQLVEAYAYDAQGQLAVVYDANGVSKRFAYDGPQIVYAEDGVGDPLWEAIWGPGTDQLLEWRTFGPSAGRHAPVTSHRNSVVGMWSPDNEALGETVEYTAEGRARLLDLDGALSCDEEGSPDGACSVGANGPRYLTGPDGSPFGFNGLMRSEITGLVYMRNRWYSPRLGQFLTHDPLGYVDSLNLYTFVGSDPVNRWDPYGLSSNGGAAKDPTPSNDEEPPTDGLGGSGGEYYGDIGQGGSMGSGGWQPNRYVDNRKKKELRPLPPLSKPKPRWIEQGPNSYSAKSERLARAIADPEAHWSARFALTFAWYENAPYAGAEDALFGLLNIHIDVPNLARSASEKTARAAIRFQDGDISEGFLELGGAAVDGTIAVATVVGLGKGVKTTVAPKGGGGSRSFFTVQNTDDAKRLAAGGDPWPSAAHRAHIGEGAYTFDSKAAAEAYLKRLKGHVPDGVDLHIVELRIGEAELGRLKAIDLRGNDSLAVQFVSRHSRLYGQGLPHEYQYVIRPTSIAPEHFFPKSVLDLFNISF
ncbi:MAG: RHS repeat domain-containing protein [Bradymonadia bacterium]